MSVLIVCPDGTKHKFPDYATDVESDDGIKYKLTYRCRKCGYERINWHFD